MPGLQNRPHLGQEFLVRREAGEGFDELLHGLDGVERDEAAADHDDAPGIAAGPEHPVEPRRAQPRVLGEDIGHDGLVGIERRGADEPDRAPEPLGADHARHRVMMDAELGGDAVSLEEATTLYRGPLLEGWTEEWVFEERQAREHAYLAALERLATSDPNRYVRLKSLSALRKLNGGLN